MTASSTGNFGAYGFLFGGTLGANYQLGALVFGLEGDGGWTDLSGFGTFTASALCAGGCNTKNTWLSTARGRIGYAFDRFLAYGTAGFAVGDVQAGYSDHAFTTATEPGWAIGVGIEGSFARNWSARVEYLFVDLASGSCTTACAITNANGPSLIPNIAVRFSENLVRAGVNYRFSF